MASMAYYEHDPYAINHQQQPVAMPFPQAQQLPPPPPQQAQQAGGYCAVPTAQFASVGQPPMCAQPQPMPAPMQHVVGSAPQYVAQPQPQPLLRTVLAPSNKMQRSTSMHGFELERHMSIDSSVSSMPDLTRTTSLDSRNVSSMGGPVTPQPSYLLHAAVLPHTDISGMQAPQPQVPQAAPLLQRPPLLRTGSGDMQRPPLLRTGSGDMRADSPPYHHTKLILDVPAADFGLLVGKKAATLQALREKCAGVTITVPRSNAAPGERVTLEGPVDMVRKARAEVEAVLGANAVPAAVASSASSSPDGGHSPLNMSGAPSPPQFASLASAADSTLHASPEEPKLPRMRLPRKLSSSSGLGSNHSCKSGDGLKKGFASLQPGHVMHPDDWECVECGNMNWAKRRQCNRCGKDKLDAQSSLRFLSGSAHYAGSCQPNVTPSDGAMMATTGWIPDMACEGGNWFCVDAGAAQSVAGVVLKGLVTSLTAQSSACGTEWCDIDGGAVFQGCVEDEPTRMVMFLKPLTARFIKVFPRTWCGAAPKLRCGLVLCTAEKASRKTGRISPVAGVAKGAANESPAWIVCTVIVAGTGRTAPVRLSLDTLTADKLKNFAHTQFGLPLDMQMTSRFGENAEDDFAAFRDDVREHRVVFCDAAGDVACDDEAVPTILMS
eukprot:TRINITY_DN1255_c1_g1_i1.p1 TRINITY_DN1255_c1_g1~~TRINITY_DN1255_c1_g1_i1.p1  ORF type:complete len:663 (+),score=180.52 TRINITY_DN1255_c1_g1_i1:63-2051(+)